MSFAFVAPAPAPAQIHAKEVHSRVVTCDGQTNPASLGHPRVALCFDESHTAVCPYCSQQFHLAANVAPGH